MTTLLIVFGIFYVLVGCVYYFVDRDMDAWHGWEKNHSPKKVIHSIRDAALWPFYREKS